MSNLRDFKHRINAANKAWKAGDYAEALRLVEKLRRDWPGNAKLLVMWAGLVQLQEETEYTQDDVRQALEEAVQLDDDAPDAALELGFFRDNIEDDPAAAIKAFSQGIATARRLLMNGLIGQAKAYRQLDKREDFLRCLMEYIQLSQFEPSKKGKSSEPALGVVISKPWDVMQFQMKQGPYFDRIQELLE